MSRRYDITNNIVMWCAQRELPQEEVAELVHAVLDVAGQSDYDCDNEVEVEAEMDNIRGDVSRIYVRTLGYEVK